MARSGKVFAATDGGLRPGWMRRRGGTAVCLLATSLVMLFLVQGVALGDTGGPVSGLRVAPVNPAFLQHMSENAEYQAAGPGSSLVTGYRPSPIDPSLTRGMQVDLPRLGVLPASYDLRSLSRVTAVRDQNPYSVCWAFAALGSLESCLLLPPSPETWDFSEDNMAVNSGFDYYNPGYPGEAPYSLGNAVMATAYLARWGGPVNEADDTYGNGSSPAGLTVQKHVQEVNWFPARGSATDNTNLKQAIISYGAVEASIYMSSSFYYWKDLTDSYYFYEDPRVYGANHAVLIVGWDDNYAASNFQHTPAGNGAFIVKNSYGTSFGAAGYFYVSYYDTTLGRVDEMALFNGAQSNTNYSRIYQYDPLGFCNAFGWYSATPDTGWFANVFTAAETSKLSAVAFYAPAPNATYEVYTGTSFSGDTLLGKTLRTAGTLPYMGYHTVTLPTPVDVTGGSQFVVAVKLTTPGYEYPIVTEEPMLGHSSAATAAAGQSYSSDYGSDWVDIAVDGMPDTNVCLKAFASSGGPPTITGVSPNFGSTAGGKIVTINGAGFTGAATVTFAGTPAAVVTVDSSVRLTAIAPAHVAAETVDVQVTTTAGSSDTSGTADDFTYMPPVTYASYRGTDRYDTAIKLSQALYSASLPAGSGLVVAPGETFPEALCGAPLAAAYGGPVLLTYKAALANNVKAELQRLAPSYVFCIGLSAAAVVSVQTALPTATVTPLTGADPYAMSRSVAGALAAKVGTGGKMTTAVGIITRGDVFPDAIGVSPLACAKLWPIILTNSATGSLHASASAAIADLGLTQALKVGTYAGLPGGVTGLANLSGADRYVTNANVADWAKTNAGLSFAHTGLATGDKFPDALASGPFLAADDGLLLLSPLSGPLPPATSALITANRAQVQRVSFIACIEPVIGQVKALLP